MPFQQTVNFLMNLGVPGDIVIDEPTRIQPATLDSNGGAFANVFTKNALTGIATQGGVIGQGTSAFTASTTNGSPTINATALGSGSIQIGQTVTGSGIPASTTIIAYVTGGGGTGTYTMSANATATASGVSVTGSGGTATVFAGIAVLPKQEALYGSSATNPLSPSLTAQPNSTVSMLTMGSFVASLPAAFNVGDIVYYNVTTGVLQTAAPGASVPAGCAAVPNCVVYGSPGQAGDMAGSSAAALGICRITAPN